MNVTRTTARTATTALFALLATAACATTQTASTPVPATTPPVAAADAATITADTSSPSTDSTAASPSATTPPPAEPSQVAETSAEPDVEPETPTEPAAEPATEPEQPSDPSEPAPGDPDPVDPTPFVLVDTFEQVVPTPPKPTVPLVKIPTVLVLPPSSCGVAGTIPGNASNVETMVFDVNADGDADTVTTYFAAIGDSAGWRLRTELAGGPLDDIAIEGVGPGAARILGPTQVDYSVADQTTWPEELLVQAGANSSGVNLGVFGLDDDGCLFRFRNEMGNDLVLPIHGSIGARSGLRCDAVSGHRFLVQLRAEHDQGSMHFGTETILARSGDALLPDAEIFSDIDGDVQVDWLDQFGELNCGSTKL